MRFKGTLALLLVFLGLGAYVYFAEYRGKEERQRAEESKKKVFQVEDKDITEISLVYPDRTLTAVKKGDMQWEITSPVGMEADSSEWEQLASNLGRVEREDTVASQNADLVQFGLDKPTVTVNAKLKNGSTLTLLFGGENPRKTYNYAK